MRCRRPAQLNEVAAEPRESEAPLLPTPDYCWRFVDRRSKNTRQIPATSPESETQQGFCFVGPTVVYVYMQTTGMLNAHFVDCFRHREIQRDYNTESFTE
jgi:hypothetical protein